MSANDAAGTHGPDTIQSGAWSDALTGCELTLQFWRFPSGGTREMVRQRDASAFRKAPDRAPELRDREDSSLKGWGSRSRPNRPAQPSRISADDQRA